MHDIRQIRQDSSEFDRQMKRRGLSLNSADILSIDFKKRSAVTELQMLQQKRNKISKEVGEARRVGHKSDHLVEEVSRLKNAIIKMEEIDRELSVNLEESLSELPNYLAEDVPQGNSELDNIELRNEGIIRPRLFQPKDQRSTIMLGDKNQFRFQCSHEPKQLDNLSQEFFSRLFKPLYIPLLAIVSGLLLIKSKNSVGYSRYKIIVFVTGVILISFSEILTKFFSYDLNKSFLLMIFPILISIIFYFIFYKQSLTTSK